MREKFPYYYNAQEETFDAAKRLRKELTSAEDFLWQILRRKSLKGYKFRRQHPIGYYVADFYCHKAKLIIEVDGEIHELEVVKRKDENRDAVMRRYGLTILRFKNEEILFNAEFVVKEIEKYLI
ncbi:MAG TPA: endonuclease domain-containing protein [Bacteroidia bacterium]|nr:endonuclease domain-containing protein [Bacteroidia bacterium]